MKFARLLGGAAFGLVALISVAAYVNARPPGDKWREIAWPFPRDGWPAGHAFRCSVSLCGDNIEVYVRPKIGFCNCDTGVADDDEVDRVADIDLISPRFKPLAPGEVIEVADMMGRVRSYEMQMERGARPMAIGIAISRHCDLMVVAAKGNVAAPKLRNLVLAFLQLEPISDWMNAALEGH